MENSEFNKVIREVYTDITSKNFLAKAMGIDPITFSWKIIEEWEKWKIRNPQEGLEK